MGAHNQCKMSNVFRVALHIPKYNLTYHRSSQSYKKARTQITENSWYNTSNIVSVQPIKLTLYMKVKVL